MEQNYEICIVPKKDCDGKTYWSATFPAIKECVGGGDTPEEAVRDAMENLNFVVEYLKDEGKALPNGYEEPTYSGKIALRISRSTHKKIAQIAKDEGVSINSLLNNAIERYLGNYDYEAVLDEKISKIQNFSNVNTTILLTSDEINKKMWNGIPSTNVIGEKI